MKVPLPCLLDGYFWGKLENGYEGELTLQGIEFGWKPDDTPQLFARPMFELDYYRAEIVAEGSYDSLFELEVPDSILQYHMLEHVWDEKPYMGKLKQIHSYSIMMYDFAVQEQSIISTRSEELDIVLLPALLHPGTPQELRRTERALYTCISEGEHHHFYHSHGASYGEPFRVNDSILRADNGQYGNVGEVIASLTVESLSRGLVTGKAGKEHPLMPIEEPVAVRLRRSMVSSANIGMEVVLNMDAQTIHYQHNPLCYVKPKPQDMTCSIYEGNLLYREAMEEADAAKGEYRQVEQILQHKLNNHCHPPLITPGLGSGPAGSLVLADLLHLPVAPDTVLETDNGEEMVLHEGLCADYLPARDRQDWNDVLGARVSNIRQEDGKTIVNLKDADPEQVRQFILTMHAISEHHQEPCMEFSQ